MSLQSAFFPFDLLPWLLLGALAAGLAGCDESKSKTEAAKSEESQTEDGSQTPSPERTATDERIATDDPESQLQADLDDAISLLEKGDVATFIERYMPLEFVQRIRKQSFPIEQVAKGINLNGRFQKDFLAKLRDMRKGEVVFLDKGKSLARLEVEQSPEDLTPPKMEVANPADEKIPATEGFSGDIQKAIGKAVAALEAKEYQKFIENMFPPSELYLTTSDESMRGLLLRLEEHPQMAEQMLTDLKALQKLTPEMDKQQISATFPLNEGTKQARTVRFEKQDTWRFANTAETVRTQVYKQAQQMLSTAKSPPEIEWIRVRDHWRLSQMN